jgi:hypothetical protein
VEIRICTTDIGPVRVDRACVVDQEGARRKLEEVPFTILILNNVLRNEILSWDLQVASETVDRLSLEQRAEDLAAVSAFPTLDPFRHFLVVFMNDGIDFFDRRSARLKQTPILSVVILFLSRQRFDSVDIGFEYHVHIR